MAHVPSPARRELRDVFGVRRALVGRIDGHGCRPDLHRRHPVDRDSNVGQRFSTRAGDFEHEARQGVVDLRDALYARLLDDVRARIAAIESRAIVPKAKSEASRTTDFLTNVSTKTPFCYRAADENVGFRRYRRTEAILQFAFFRHRRAKQKRNFVRTETERELGKSIG